MITAIGKVQVLNNVFLAPMAGITDPPFRSISRDFGCSLGFTEMISAEGLVRRSPASLHYLKRFSDETPFAVQIFGSKPEIMAEAARICADSGADIIDINMGCPAKKILRNGAGAALMKDPAKIKRILNRVRSAISAPLTIKMRSGWKGDLNAPLIAAIAEGEGVDAVIIHPRTVEQAFSGKADWSVIRKVKRSVRIPIIGNGDITNAYEAVEMQEQTGCDGVMIGRTAVGNPWIFREIDCFRRTGERPADPDPQERKRVVENHWEKDLLFYNSRALKLFKIRLPWYTKGLRGSSAFRREIADCDEGGKLMAKCREFFDSLG